MLKLKTHPFNYLILPLMGIIAIFSSKNNLAYLIIDTLMLVNLLIFQAKIKWKSLAIFALTLIPALLSFYISTRLFMNNLNESGVNGLTLTTRLFSLAIVSYLYATHLPQESLINNLMQRKILSINIGFAFLAVFNAFEQFGKEFHKIQLAYRMRFGKLCLSPKIIFPLFVYAARYAHCLTISMYTRGINNNRSFYDAKIPYRIIDWLIVIINLTIISIVIFKISSQYII